MLEANKANDKVVELTDIEAMTINANAVTDTEVASNVVNIRSARKAQQKAQQELLDYMMWTMKHDMDPHRLHDDPVEVFRAEMKAKISQDVA